MYQRICAYEPCTMPFSTAIHTQTFCSRSCRSRARGMQTTDDIKQYFLSKVQMPVAESDSRCWLWLGTKDKHGYGRPKIQGVKILAHRLAWTLFVGPVPEEMDVLHSCNVPACVNPEDLYLGTDKENGTDRAKAGVMRQHNLTDDQILAMRKLRYDNPDMTFDQIGFQYHIPAATAQGICRGRICRHLDMTYVDASPLHAKGRSYLGAEEQERRRQAKTASAYHTRVDEMDAAQIRRDYASGQWTQTALAKRQHVSQATIWNIIHGVTFTHEYVPIAPIIPPRVYTARTTVDDSTIRRARTMREQGATFAAIAQELGMTPKRAWDLAHDVVQCSAVVKQPA